MAKSKSEVLREIFPQAFVKGELDLLRLSLLLNDGEEPKPQKDIPPSAKNILLRAENLQALRAMHRNYAQRFDMLYIDPPYNTGGSFTYDDSLGEDWFSMMRDRLLAAKELLTDDAVIFVSIGDEEVHRLRFLLEMVFGSENYIGTFVWVKKKKGSHLSATLRSVTEYVLCCSMNKSKTNLFGEKAYSNKWQPLIKKKNRLK
ncbi:MAG: site-specific DNA-methyltransferase, partial [Pseudomonadota bacterium]|nr:site-specific DNA-methyltransferase [Pseudomonadota bacterium]